MRVIRVLSSPVSFCDISGLSFVVFLQKFAPFTTRNAPASVAPVFVASLALRAVFCDMNGLRAAVPSLKLRV